MADKVWVYIDQNQGEAIPASWEVMGAAKEIAGQLGGGVTAVVAGSGVQGVADLAAQYGANQVYLCEDSTLEEFRAEPLAAGFPTQHAPCPGKLSPTAVHRYSLFLGPGIVPPTAIFQPAPFDPHASR